MPAASLEYTAPPPHPLWLTIFLGLLATVVWVVTILGNTAVLLVFVLDHTIQQPNNYFLASLAVSDLLIGSFSMPLYTQYLLIGEWLLGPWLCDLWLSLDWTICLTSIYTVLLITMDRFLSVKIPAKYRKWRTRNKVLVMIAVTWIFPAFVFFTPGIRWRFFVGTYTVGAKQCEVQFLGDPMFTFLLAIGYYWIALVVMCILYGEIYKVALNLQGKSDAKKKKMQSTMKLAGVNPSAAIRSFGGEGEGGSNNNSSDDGDSHVPSQAHNNSNSKFSKSEKQKLVKAALPCPPGAQNINITSFSTKIGWREKDEDRSSSPAYASDDENSSSRGATGSAKSPLTTGKSNKPGGIVNSVLYANTGDLVRSLHGDPFFNNNQARPEGQILLQPPPPYSRRDDKSASDTASDADGGQRQEFDSVYSSSASDHLEKETTPLLQNEINKGCLFTDKKTFMGTLSSESAALLPVVTNESEMEDSDVADLHASSPIWKRRNSLPPLTSDVFDLDDDVSDCLIITDLTTTTVLPTASTKPISGFHKYDGGEQQLQADTANTVASTTTGADTTTDNSSHNKPSQQAPDTGNSTGNNCTNAPLSETNTNKDISRSRTSCHLQTSVNSVNDQEPGSISGNRARKALRTISFILGAFVLCWTPYHVAIMVIALCKDCVNGYLYSFSYWMGYLNSAINPFCYAFASAHFKRTFLRIMRFDWHRE